MDDLERLTDEEIAFLHHAPESFAYPNKRVRATIEHLQARVEELESNQIPPGCVAVCRECREPMNEPGIPNCVNHKWTKALRSVSPSP